MDCAQFIRRKTIMISWLAVPPLVLIVFSMGVNSFYAQQRTTFEQKSSLARIIPTMQEEADHAAVYLNTFRIDPAGGTMREVYINLINRIATQSGLQMESINADLTTLDPELGTAKVTLHLQSSGTCRQIAEFLIQLKEADPLIFEDKLTVLPERRRDTAEFYKFKTDLIRVYVD